MRSLVLRDGSSRRRSSAGGRDDPENNAGLIVVRGEGEGVGEWERRESSGMPGGRLGRLGAEYLR